MPAHDFSVQRRGSGRWFLSKTSSAPNRHSAKGRPSPFGVVTHSGHHGSLHLRTDSSNVDPEENDAVSHSHHHVATVRRDADPLDFRGTSFLE